MSLFRCTPFAALPFLACSGLPHHTEPVLAPISSSLPSEVEPPAAALPPAPRARPKPGAALGRFRLTYYWMARQPAKARSRGVALRDRRGHVIARVSRRFARKVRLEGTGVLRDGRVVNVAGGCRRSRRCYTVLDATTPFGIGARERPLWPFRSVAAPPRVAVGTKLYIPELDGVRVPGPWPQGGYVHDGCVVADDRGGGIKGRQLDLFMARRSTYDAFKHHRLTRVHVYRGGARCAKSDRLVVALRRFVADPPLLAGK